MIDLDQSARALQASVAHVQPDLDRVHRIVRRRRRRRQVIGVAGGFVLVAAGVALASAAGTGGRTDHLRTDEPPAPTPAPGDASARIVDHSGMRITVPAGWAALTDGDVPDGACAAAGLILVGYGVEPPAACADLPVVELSGGGGSGGPGTEHGGGGRPGSPAETTTANGHRLYRDGAVEGEANWSVPDLNGTIVGRNGADLRPIFASLRRSARWVAVDDVTGGATPGWIEDPSAWREVSLGEVVVRVPVDWPAPSDPAPPSTRVNPCDQWREDGPTVRLDAARGTGCGPARPWVPAEGVWLLPPDAIEPRDVRDLGLENREGTSLTLVDELLRPVLDVVVHDADGRLVGLVRIGLGDDGHVAGSIVDSIRVDPAGGSDTGH